LRISHGEALHLRFVRLQRRPQALEILLFDFLEDCWDGICSVYMCLWQFRRLGLDSSMGGLLCLRLEGLLCRSDGLVHSLRLWGSQSDRELADLGAALAWILKISRLCFHPLAEYLLEDMLVEEDALVVVLDCCNPLMELGYFLILTRIRRLAFLKRNQ
jgi:hypothetical protein